MVKEHELAELAVDQWGLVTTGQARMVGVAPQVMAAMARSGDLVRLAHGVYRLAGSPIDEQEELRAAWLALNPIRTAGERIAESDVDVVSHRSAARLRGLGDLDADVMEFTVSRRRQTRRTDMRFHRGTVIGRDWNLVGGLPVTIALRTIDDLAEERIDRGHLASIVRDALSLNQVAEDELARVLTRHARGYGSPTGDGRGLLRVMLQEAGGQVLAGAPLPEAFRGLDAEAIRAILPSLTAEVMRAFSNTDAIRSLLNTDVANSLRGAGSSARPAGVEGADRDAETATDEENPDAH